MKKLARVLSVACIAAAPMLLPATAAAQFAKPEDAIKYRQSVLTVMSNHFGRIAPVVRGQQPYDPAQVQADVAIVAMMSKLPWSAFGEGTEGGGARPAVWSDNAKFKQGQERLQGDIAKLVAAAQSGDLAQVRTAYGAVGASCKACHDNFRNR
ncbi:cytochrome C [Pigmentiphaga sp. NML080357]|uniref:c-type cytochrome n=1 Tax=Pigmentiphaga sp. NML080357 TaxID=2008675 RepID=UPI000B40CA93|nr:cytochrome c [Pigmentiphaga sp. NML080357]OVZ57223.1 cytochrome C [Pigmentiphaga sp. NML080357]